MSKSIKAMDTPDLDLDLTAELLGQAIKARRTQSHLRLEDAASLCNVAKDTLMKIEHGHPSCQLSSVLKVCDGLGVRLRIMPWQQGHEVSDDWS